MLPEIGCGSILALSNGFSSWIFVTFSNGLEPIKTQRAISGEDHLTSTPAYLLPFAH